MPKGKRAKKRPTWQVSYLRQYRKAAKLSQEQAAEKLGIDRGYLSKIETGKQQWNQDVMQNAALLYGCRVSDLIDRPPEAVRKSKAA